MNLLRIEAHYSKSSKSLQNVVINYIFSSESLRVVNSVQIANSLRILFLVCRALLGEACRNKAGRSDFRDQRFEADTRKMWWKLQTFPLTPEEQGSEEIPRNKNTENAENPDTKRRKP